MIITALTMQPRSQDRADLYVDGQLVCGVALEMLFANDLRVGDEISNQTIDALRAQEAFWQVKQAAFSLLSVRARSRGELADRLRRKGFDAPLIEEVLHNIEALGLLDDAIFAESWVRDRVRLRPRGAAALVAELARKKVQPDVARNAVQRVLSAGSVSEDQMCVDAAERYLRTKRDRYDRDVLERRLYGYLTRRGFPSASVRSAVRNALDAMRTTS